MDRSEERFAYGKVIFTCLQMPQSIFIVYLYIRFYYMGTRLLKQVTLLEPNQKYSDSFKWVMRLVTFASIW